ncbi:MAG TPA: MarR family transcriptional regulator [Rhizobiaceae bacterium]|nr:MarR family transcriptional regulator [Rhizobiaceae bacterium]
MSEFYVEKDNAKATGVLTRLQNAARAARTTLAVELLDTGLYAGQDALMRALDAEDGLTLGQIAERLGVKPPTITKTVSRLQAQGFVEKRGSETDQRQSHVFLTDNGKGVIRMLEKSVRKAEKKAVKGWKKKERKALLRLLAKLEENLSGKPVERDDAAEAPEPAEA